MSSISMTLPCLAWAMHGCTPVHRQGAPKHSSVCPAVVCACDGEGVASEVLHQHGGGESGGRQGLRLPPPNSFDLNSMSGEGSRGAGMAAAGSDSSSSSRHSR